MQSENRSWPTVGYDRSSSRFGSYTNSYIGQGVFRKLTVVNGLVLGDKKSPNPITFSKTSTPYQQYRRLTLRSGYPVGSEDELYREYGVSPWSTSAEGVIYTGLSNQAALYDTCLKRVYDQMRYGSGNLAVDLAEAKQTVKMIRNASSVRKVAKEFMRGLAVPKNYSSSRRLKYATDKWLEYRYGWLPFVSSTYELLKTLAHRVDSGSVATIEARAANKVDKDVFLNLSPTYNGGQRQAFDRINHSTRILLKFQIRPRTTLEIYDFTSLNPLGIAWELVPLSFVADWFVNIGDCMSLWEDHILFANRFVSGFKTTTVSEDVVHSDIDRYNTAPAVFPNGQQQNDIIFSYNHELKVRHEFRYKNRETLASIPSPGGVRVKVNLNSNRMLDAAALIRAAFGNPKLK